MAKQSVAEDRNFDDLAERFKRNIYGGLRGDIRLAVLSKDFKEFLPSLMSDDHSAKKLRILDAGGGQGQFSLPLACLGHELVVCDISTNMLEEARCAAVALGVSERVTLVNSSIQLLPEALADCQFDVVICHAVMEWMAEPQTLLPCLSHYLKQGGALSLTYYNIHSLVYKNLLRANFQKIIDQDYRAHRGSLTPISPITPEQVDQDLAALGYVTLVKSGIRVFHDYILDRAAREENPSDLLELEIRLSRQLPYRDLGRYIHVIARQPQAS